ncbi:hypothetical protein NZD89_22170 [Alicyclobacillus fastidiosus]|uniref:Photosynthesis system II assembly factor Ycf48/Hcf136-like domain-containing protein n=1 Tax=Alicyclobacillus fastidiosus TaxID=392011 RepID=A0ABY6ZDK4_9BACL|nr:hypothetical protein [Alicyclobacillus fastidiosus]WAH40965.1 hypothetical protein NZD89_22170 [Alicyclobacillus fastidiosus]GMA62479.1 hypothetical protein GCM10025859_29190 [Alicyclobacillus fastidiosus]
MRFARLSGLTVACLAMLSLTGCASPLARSTPASVTSATRGDGSDASSGSDSSHSTPLTTETSSNAFDDQLHLRQAHLQMIDTTTGYAWGYAAGTFKLYATSDGARTWRALTLPALPKYTVTSMGVSGYGYVQASFADASTGFLTWLTPSGVHVLRTTDGGLSWTQSDIAAPADASQIGQMFFSTNKLGWMLLLGDGATGAASKYLYRTSNGGTSWQEVNSSASALPHNGVNLDVSFSSDGSHGVFAADDPLSKTPEFEQTSDGGKSWSTVVTDPVPEDPSHPVEDVTPLPPVVDGDAESADFVLSSSAGDELLMVTSDLQGHAISRTLSVGQVLALAWNESNATLLEIENGNETLLQTTDGGLDWTTIGTLPDSLTGGDTDVQDFQMFGQTGWVLLQDDALKPILLKTTDNGAHWVAI